MTYVGEKFWIKPNQRGRIIEIRDDIIVVQEDFRLKVDGNKENPIYEFLRNTNGETHTISLKE